MSSAAGKTPAPGQAVYSASKHALNGYFHSLRSEVMMNLMSLWFCFDIIIMAYLPVGNDGIRITPSDTWIDSTKIRNWFPSF